MLRRVSKREFREWLENPVSGQLTADLKQRIEEGRDQLERLAENAEQRDDYIRGALYAFRIVLDFEPEFDEGEQDETSRVSGLD